MASFLQFVIETDEEVLVEEYRQQVSDEFPGWVSPPGSYEEFLALVWARMAVETAELAADVPAEIFHRFGEKILNLPPTQAQPATALSTWTMRDDAGYFISEGTLVSVYASGSEQFGFYVLSDVLIPQGTTTVTDVSIVAVEPGAYANDASGVVTLLDAIPYVDSITLQGPTQGGQDEEDPDEYLDRLASEAQLLAPRPILPSDGAVLIRRVPGIFRALALDLYDPNSDTWSNERTTTYVVADEEGEALAAPIKAAGEAMLEAQREINFQFFVIDPTYTTIDVEFEVEILAGFARLDVESAVVDAVTNYLSPSRWGAPRLSDSPAFWDPAETVYINELISLIDSVSGVDRVVSVELAEQGNALAASDVALSGPGALTRPGNIGAAA